MRLNSLLYSDQTARKMLYAGAVSAHTTHPSTAALSRNIKKTPLIEKAAKRDAKPWLYAQKTRSHQLW